MSQIKQLLDNLGLADLTGKYDNHFYVIDLQNSDNYSACFSQLEENALNTEFPTIETDKSGDPLKINNYFEAEVGIQKYNLFLIANFEEDSYYLKIKEV